MACLFTQAAANAKNNLGLRKAKLYVSECMADAGPILKRIRPRAKGRCAPLPFVMGVTSPHGCRSSLHGGVDVPTPEGLDSQELRSTTQLHLAVQGCEDPEAHVPPGRQGR